MESQHARGLEGAFGSMHSKKNERQSWFYRDTIKGGGGM